MTPLSGLRVVDRTREIAGPYCSKLLADAGADVVIVEPEGGDAFRAWRSGALFEYLNAAKRTVVTGSDGELVAHADVLLTADPHDVGPARAVNPGLVVVTITPTGCDGPWAARPTSEFTLQAACGSMGHRGLPEQPPLAAGGRMGDWITGTYAAVAAIAALAAGRGEHIDVAMLDCMAVTMATFPSVFAEMTGWPTLTGTGRAIEVPSIIPTADGWVVVTTNSTAQLQDFLIQIGRPDLVDDPGIANVRERFARRAEFLAAVHAYSTQRTASEVLDDAAAFRVPAGPVLNGATVADFEQFSARQVFVPSASGRLRQPRRPYRFDGDSGPAPGVVPPPGGTDAPITWPARVRADPSAAPGALPLEGVRILDCTAWWAGPASTHVLACLGADVIKIESTTRPDLMRYASVRPPTVDRWWEWGPIVHGTNTNKRGVTIDLSTIDGVSLFERLATTADVVVENYTPRVMDQFGLGWDRLHIVNPSLVYVRMPAFGVDGPWRDRTGFAQTMESITGLAWQTGFADGPPVLVRGACDPLAGLHAAFATLTGLRQRDATGVGMLVEATMIEAAVGTAVEAIFEHQLTGTVLDRIGNRSHSAAPQGAYQCAGTDSWLALSVTDDAQWSALRTMLIRDGTTAAADARFDNVAGRRAAHDEVDALIINWAAERDAAPAVDALVAAGVPAAIVIAARDIVHNPQLCARGLFETEHHPVTGDAQVPMMPFRFASIDRWLRSASPTLGQHNREILGVVASAAELDQLEDSGAIGERPRGL